MEVCTGEEISDINHSLTVKWKPEFEPQQLVKVLSLCEEFLLDAAVLIFVFPVLDTAIQFGKKAITTGLVLSTLAISAVFFVCALILGMKEVKSREE